MTQNEQNGMCYAQTSLRKSPWQSDEVLCTETRHFVLSADVFDIWCVAMRGPRRRTCLQVVLRTSGAAVAAGFLCWKPARVPKATWTLELRFAVNSRAALPTCYRPLCTGSSGTCVAQWCRGALARGAGSFGFGQNPATASPGCGRSIRNPLYMAQVRSFGRVSTEFLVDFAQQWLSSIFANFTKTCVFLAPSHRFCSKQEFLKSLGSQSEHFAFQPFYSIFQAISAFCLCRYEFFSGQFESSWRTGHWGRSEGLRRVILE